MAAPPVVPADTVIVTVTGEAEVATGEKSNIVTEAEGMLSSTGEESNAATRGGGMLEPAGEESKVAVAAEVMAEDGRPGEMLTVDTPPTDVTEAGMLNEVVVPTAVAARVLSASSSPTLVFGTTTTICVSPSTMIVWTSEPSRRVKEPSFLFIRGVTPLHCALFFSTTMQLLKPPVVVSEMRP